MSNNGNPSAIRRNVGEGEGREKVLNGLLNKISEPSKPRFNVKGLKGSILGLFGTNKTVYDAELAMELTRSGYDVGHEHPTNKLKDYVGQGRKFEYSGFLGRKHTLTIIPQEGNRYKLTVD